MKDLKIVLEASILAGVEDTLKDGDIIMLFDRLKNLIINKSSYFANNNSFYVLEIKDVDEIFDYFNIKYKNDASIIINIMKYDVDMNIYDYEWNLRFSFYDGDKCINDFNKTFYTKQIMFSKFLETKIEPLVRDLKAFEKFIKENK